VSLECVVVTEGSLLSIAVCGGDGVVSGYAWNRGLRVGNDLSALHVEAFDLSQRVADELSDNREDFGGVDCQAVSVE